MRPFLPTVALLLGAPLLAQTPAWVPASYGGHGCRVEWPDQPQYQGLDTQVEGKAIKVHRYLCKQPEGVIFLLAVAPDASGGKKTLADRMGDLKDQMGSQTTFSGIRELQVQDLPTLEYEAIQGPSQLRARLLVSQGRVYQWMVLRPTGKPIPPDGERFLASFALIPVKQAAHTGPKANK